MTMAVNTPSTHIFISKMNPCLEKWLIPDLGQGKHKMSFMVLESKETFEDW